MSFTSKLFWVSLWQGLRFADVLDVLAVAVFVYAATSWFRKARSRFVIVGIAALVGLYFVARLLDLYLTLMLFQVGITVAVIALVVIFQEEIKRAFERIGSGRVIAARLRSAPMAGPVDTITSTVFELARDRVGALLVFPGKDPLERHITGGFSLHGELSKPLLRSIFDHHSPGHDGAVIVQGATVQRFGVHLPLSTDVPPGSPPGTRHTAAIGLSERSDALVVVVSEERGAVSVAQEGKLTVEASPSNLKKRLAAFARTTAPPTHTTWAAVLTRNHGAKLLSLLAAAVAWVILVGHETEIVARAFQVPITYRNLPDGWVVEEPRPMEARVTVAGPDRAMRLLDPSSLVIPLDVGKLRAGSQRVSITGSKLPLPRDLTLQRIEPEAITMVAWETQQVTLPIVPRTVGQIPSGQKLKSVRTEPARIALVVRRVDLGKVTRVETAPVDLSEITGKTVVRTPLALPEKTRIAKGEPNEVQVLVELRQ